MTVHNEAKNRISRTLLIRTTVDPYRIRQRLRVPIEQLDAEKLAVNRARAESLIRRVRANVERARSPEAAARIKRVATKRRALHARLKRALGARELRSPEQVIQSFVRRISIDRRERAIAVPASLLIRSKCADVEERLATIFGSDVTVAGIIVRRVPVAGMLAVFSVRFPITHRAVSSELRNLAWALRRTGAFESVSVHGLLGFLYAPAPTAATRAERNFVWHHELTRTSLAHHLEPAGPNGKPLGAGIVIAHPDTGWAEHSQYNEDRIDTARSHNVVTGQTGGKAATHSVRNIDALDPRRANITHGTATASLMVGGAVDDRAELSTTRPDSALAFETGIDGKRKAIGTTPFDRKGHLTGVAPRATVLPIKLISDTGVEEIPTHGFEGLGVIRLFDDDLVDAVQYAIEQSAHVISLSVGGLMHDEVREKLDEAIRDHDIIVVAAAGQTYSGNAVSAVAGPVSLTGLADDSVVLPAAYANVIAVAGCAPNGAPWSESHRGPNVDIVAPADAIWVADFAKYDLQLSPDASRDEVLECASGTSFATAFMAGVAALWLAHWGRDHLTRIYRERENPVPFAWVFRHQLQRTANSAHANDWDDGRYGPGVVNVEALLREELPDPEDVEAPPAMVANLFSIIGAPLPPEAERLFDFFDSFNPDAMGKAIEAVVGGVEREVEKGLNALAVGWAVAESQANELAGRAQEEAAKTRDDIEQLIEDTVRAGEELIEQTAADAEDALEAVEERAEEFIDGAGEAAEDFVNLLNW